MRRQYMTEMESALYQATRIEDSYQLNHPEMTQLYVKEAKRTAESYQDNPHAIIFLEGIIREAEEHLKLK